MQGPLKSNLSIDRATVLKEIKMKMKCNIKAECCKIGTSSRISMRSMSLGIQIFKEEMPGISHPRIKVSSSLKELFFVIFVI